MLIRVGFGLVYEFAQKTPIVLMLNVHPSRARHLVKPDHLRVSPALPVTRYLDAFDNICSRLVAPAGEVTISTDAIIADCGQPDAVHPAARQHEVGELPHEALVFLLGSRYCETERLMKVAWEQFRPRASGLGRASRRFAISCTRHIRVRLSTCARDAHRVGSLRGAPRRVPRFCASRRHLLPLHEHSSPLLHGVSRRHRRSAGARADGFQRLVRGLSGWALVHLRCPRNNAPRIGRIVIARGRDAADVALSTTFGPNTIKRFTVVTDEIEDAAAMPVLERMVA